MRSLLFPAGRDEKNSPGLERMELRSRRFQQRG
ncbi:hypothetical protein BH18ACT4_BH18ACT4_16270 [soil metagenome]